MFYLYGCMRIYRWYELVSLSLCSCCMSVYVCITVNSQFPSSHAALCWLSCDTPYMLCERTCEQEYVSVAIQYLLSKELSKALIKIQEFRGNNSWNILIENEINNYKEAIIWTLKTLTHHVEITATSTFGENLRSLVRSWLWGEIKCWKRC